MNIEEVRTFCLSLKNVTEDMPFGDDTLIFRVENKIFLALSLDNIEPKIAIKGNPDTNIELREKYSSVVPAYHWNKTYWNNIMLEGDMPTSGITYWIENSYNEVIKKLPKKIRDIYPHNQ